MRSHSDFKDDWTGAHLIPAAPPKPAPPAPRQVKLACNPKESQERDKAILRNLRKGPMTARQLREIMPGTLAAMDNAINRLRSKGLIVKVGTGKNTNGKPPNIWGLVE